MKIVRAVHLLVLVISYAALPVAAMAYQHFALGRGFDASYDDSVIGFFSLGLNWVTGTPNIYFHHPGYLFQELAGVLTWLALQTSRLPDETALERFYGLGIVIHLFFLLAAAVWFGRLAERHGLRAWQVALVSAASFTMPILLLQCTHYSDYFLLGSFLPPVTLALYFGSTSDLTSRRTRFLGLFALGLLVASLFIAAFIALPVLLWLARRAQMHGREGPSRVPRACGSSARSRRSAAIAVGLASGSVLLTVVFIGLFFAGGGSFEELPTSLSVELVTSRPFAVAAALALGAGLLSARLFLRSIIDRPRWRVLALDGYAPVLWGWLAGANLMAPFWLVSVVHVSQLAGGGFDPVTLVTFLGLRSWTWMLVLVLLVLGAIALRRAGGRRLSREDRFMALFAGLGIGLNFAFGLSAMVHSESATGGCEGFGFDVRYFMVSIPFVVGSLLWTFRRVASPRTRVLFVACVALTSAASAVDFVRSVGCDLAWRKPFVAELDRETEHFLAKHPSGIVVCARDETSRACHVGYAWNRYRTRESQARWHVRWLYDDRVLYVRRNEFNSARVEEWASGHDPLLVIGFDEAVAARFPERTTRVLGYGIEAAIVHLTTDGGTPR